MLLQQKVLYYKQSLHALHNFLNVSQTVLYFLINCVDCYSGILLNEKIPPSLPSTTRSAFTFCCWLTITNAPAGATRRKIGNIYRPRTVYRKLITDHSHNISEEPIAYPNCSIQIPITHNSQYYLISIPVFLMYIGSENQCLMPMTVEFIVIRLL